MWPKSSNLVYNEGGVCDTIPSAPNSQILVISSVGSHTPPPLTMDNMMWKFPLLTHLSLALHICVVIFPKCRHTVLLFAVLISREPHLCITAGRLAFPDKVWMRRLSLPGAAFCCPPKSALISRAPHICVELSTLFGLAAGLRHRTQFYNQDVVILSRILMSIFNIFCTKFITIPQWPRGLRYQAHWSFWVPLKIASDVIWLIELILNEKKTLF